MSDSGKNSRPGHWERYQAFLDGLHKDVYPETPSQLHTDITRKQIALVSERHLAPGPKRILDIGCGQGVALEVFQAAGHDALGIALGEDVAICRAKGLNAVEMSMAFLDFPEGDFDLVWCRHAIEHSVSPLFTLTEIHRVLRPGGLVYVEVPAPDTACGHQTNPNHYSVLPRSMWLELFKRAGFELAQDDGIRFKTPVGEDVYWWFVLRRPIPKPAAQPGGQGAAAVPPPDQRLPIHIQFPVSSFFGWGMYALNLTMNWASDDEVWPVVWLPPRMDEVSQDPFRMAVLRGIFADSDARRAALQAGHDGGPLLPIKAPVLTALVENLAAFRADNVPFLRGKANIGIYFTCESEINAEGRGTAKHYDQLVAGCTWNEEVVRASGIDNVTTVIQGVDTTLFHPAPAAGILKDRFLIFSGGKLEFRKGQDLVLLAFKAFRERHPEAMLVTAWHSPWPGLAKTVQVSDRVPPVPFKQDSNRPDTKLWARQMGIPPEAMVDLGAVPNPQMPPILREMDVALFPNRCEPGTNLVAMEAMACGVPCILSRNTGHLDIVGEDDCYALRRQTPVPRDLGGWDGWGESDVEEIVEALEQVWRNRAEARRRGALGAAKMARLSWANQSRQLRDVIKRFS